MKRRKAQNLTANELNKIAATAKVLIESYDQDGWDEAVAMQDEDAIIEARDMTRFEREMVKLRERLRS